MNEPSQLPPQPEQAFVVQPARDRRPRDAWRSEELLGDRPEVLILHNNEVYRLRRTRQGKLILHK
jgi:hemin uptake protein HemP